MILIAGLMICSTSSPIPAFLLVAWDRVRGNKGARSAGSGRPDRLLRRDRAGRRRSSTELRDGCGPARSSPLPVQGTDDPQTGDGKRRRLGIPTVADRVVQASLKLVLEPIFEADFEPCSYGFRPNRRAHDAVAEIRHFTSRTYEWVRGGRHQGVLRRDRSHRR